MILSLDPENPIQRRKKILHKQTNTHKTPPKPKNTKTKQKKPKPQNEKTKTPTNKQKIPNTKQQQQLHQKNFAKPSKQPTKPTNPTKESPPKNHPKACRVSF